MGKNHIRLAKEMNNEFEFVGVFDPDKERVKALGLTDLCFETEDALIDAADAVIVAAPSSLHKKIALKVAAAGKHLLVEKPIALSAADGQEIVDAFADTKQVLQVGHVERFNPVVLELEKIVKNEEVESAELFGLTELGASALNYKIKIVATPETKGRVRRSALKTIVETLESKKIAIPYNQLDIHQK